jgi:hypothetical protein
MVKPEFLVHLYILREGTVERSIQNKRLDTVRTPKPMVGSNLFAVRLALTKTWLTIADPEVPAIMIYCPESSILIQEGALCS